MCVKRLQVLVLLGLAVSGWVGVRGMRVYTSGDVQAVNGTDVWLKCTFETSATIRPATLVVSWSFRPLGPGHEESVFYYQEKPYPPMDGRFRKRAMWAGDIFSRDASIIIREVKFTYNGTFSCQVKNPPDVHGNVGEVRLRVVHSSPFSEIMMLALFIGGGIVLLLLALVVIVLIRRRRKKRDQDAPGARREYKDPTMCHPSRAVHLYMEEEMLEIDSSDGMISDASTKDPSSSEDEDDDDDDDDDGDDDDD